MTLAGKTLIVTGGNRGLGLELCKMALQKGAKKIIMGCRDLTAGHEAARCFGPSLSSKVAVVPFDAEHIEPSAAHLVELAQSEPVNILVNNAAIYSDEWDEPTFTRCLQTNVWAPVALIQALAPYMRPGSVIVNVTSSLGMRSYLTPQYAKAVEGAQSLSELRNEIKFDSGSKLGSAGTPTYKLSKAMLNRATQLLAPQLRETGIAVNVVDPGWCRTDMGGEYAPNSAEDGAAAILWAVVHGSVSKGMTGRFLTARGEERDW